jgi:hypothetical protein
MTMVAMMVLDVLQEKDVAHDATDRARYCGVAKTVPCLPTTCEGRT